MTDDDRAALAADTLRYMRADSGRFGADEVAAIDIALESLLAQSEAQPRMVTEAYHDEVVAEAQRQILRLEAQPPTEPTDAPKRYPNPYWCRDYSDPFDGIGLKGGAPQ